MGDTTLPIRIKADPRRPLIIVATPEVCTMIDAVANATGGMNRCDRCNQPLYVPCITSGVEGVHSDGSDHFRNSALDFRRFDWEPDRDKILASLKARLPDGYRYLLEQDHLHVERHRA